MALKKLPISLPEKLIAQARAIAAEEDRFLSDIIREALEMYLTAREAEAEEEGEEEEDEDTEEDPTDDEVEEEPADDEK
jgi:metal-responsive CopG/Arc/MetJ family transcriptional regulator